MRLRQEAQAVPGQRGAGPRAQDRPAGLPRDYDDGGLVDVNHVPATILAARLGLAPAEVTAVTAARGQLGRFSTADELSVYAKSPA
jgi:hypothetical protein